MIENSDKTPQPVVFLPKGQESISLEQLKEKYPELFDVNEAQAELTKLVLEELALEHCMLGCMDENGINCFGDLLVGLMGPVHELLNNAEWQYLHEVSEPDGTDIEENRFATVQITNASDILASVGQLDDLSYIQYVDSVYHYLLEMIDKYAEKKKGFEDEKRQCDHSNEIAHLREKKISLNASGKKEKFEEATSELKKFERNQIGLTRKRNNLDKKISELDQNIKQHEFYITKLIEQFKSSLKSDQFDNRAMEVFLFKFGLDLKDIPDKISMADQLQKVLEEPKTVSILVHDESIAIAERIAKQRAVLLKWGTPVFMALFVLVVTFILPRDKVRDLFGMQDEAGDGDSGQDFLKDLAKKYPDQVHSVSSANEALKIIHEKELFEKTKETFVSLLNDAGVRLSNDEKKEFEVIQSYRKLIDWVNNQLRPAVLERDGYIVEVYYKDETLRFLINPLEKFERVKKETLVIIMSEVELTDEEADSILNARGHIEMGEIIEGLSPIIEKRIGKKVYFNPNIGEISFISIN